MDRPRRKFQPLAAELESKLLLSVAPPPPAAAAAEMSVLADTSATTRGGSTPATAITAVIPAKYHATSDNRTSDMPYRVQLHGSGKVDTLGQARLVGELDLGGFRRADAPQVTGTLTLSNGRGSVQLDLSGDGDASGDVPNGHFATTATVVRATGACRGLRRDGTVSVDFGANRLHSKVPSTIGGTATVTLSFKPLVR